MGKDGPPPPDSSQPDVQYLLQRFRAALQAAHLSPNEQTVEELRTAAAPLMRQFRDEYHAAGHEDGDDAAVLRWLRSLLLQKHGDTSLGPMTGLLIDWREEEAG